MMNRRGWLLPLLNVALSVAAATLLLAAPASGQARSEGFSFGIGGGFARSSGSSTGPRTFPPEDLGGVGYYVLSTLELPSPVRFVRPRADLFFADWGQHVTGLTANVLVTPLPGKRLAPYALAGAGAYKMPHSNPKTGWTLGLGLRLPGELRSVTVESRMHAYLRGRGWEFESDRWRYLWEPIGLGVQF